MPRGKKRMAVEAATSESIDNVVKPSRKKANVNKKPEPMLETGSHVDVSSVEPAVGTSQKKIFPKDMPIGSIKKITDLPSSHLALVLKKFSLQEVLAFRLVSSRFKSAAECVCQEMTSLKLFESYHEIKTYCLDFVNIDSNSAAEMKLKSTGLNDDAFIPSPKIQLEYMKNKLDLWNMFFDFLKKLFPNVQSLVVFKSSFNDELLNLLKMWPNLKELIIHGQALPFDSFQFYKQFHPTLNSLSSLERLSLYLNEHEKIKYENLKPTLSRLRQLTLWQPPADLSILLANLGPNLTHLCLHGVDEVEFDLEKMLKINPHLASITHLSLTSFDNSDLLTSMYEHLVNLKYLNIDLVGHAYELPYMNRLHDMFENDFCNLSKLEELRISLSDLNLAYFDDIVPITSMKILYLDDADEPVKDDYGEPPEFNGREWCVKISILFPNLEQLTVRSKDKNKLAEIRKHLKQLKKLQKSLICSKDDRKRFIDYFGRYQGRYKKDRRGNKPKVVRGLVFAFEE